MPRLTLVVETTNVEMEREDWEAFGDALLFELKRAAQPGVPFAGKAANGERREWYAPTFTVTLVVEKDND